MAGTQLPDTWAAVRCWAGFASLGAGLVHLAVVPEHLRQWWLFGAFFAVAGGLQVGWALLALGRDRLPAPRLVAAAQVGLVVLWGAVRTVGLPVGPDPWTPEALGRSDLLCVVLEVGSAAATLGWLALQRRPRRPVRAGRYLATVGAGALLVAAVTTPALAATEAGGHAHPHGSHAAG